MGSYLLVHVWLAHLSCSFQILWIINLSWLFFIIIFWEEIVIYTMRGIFSSGTIVKFSWSFWPLDYPLCLTCFLGWPSCSPPTVGFHGQPSYFIVMIIVDRVVLVVYHCLSFWLKAVPANVFLTSFTVSLFWCSLFLALSFSLVWSPLLMLMKRKPQRNLLLRFQSINLLIRLKCSLFFVQSQYMTGFATKSR